MLIPLHHSNELNRKRGPSAFPAPSRRCRYGKASAAQSRLQAKQQKPQTPESAEANDASAEKGALLRELSGGGWVGCGDAWCGAGCCLKPGAHALAGWQGSVGQVATAIPVCPSLIDHAADPPLQATCG